MVELNWNYLTFKSDLAETCTLQLKVASLGSKARGMHMGPNLARSTLTDSPT